MPTECISDLFGFARVESRRVEAAFDGGAVTSNGGAFLLGATERAIGLVVGFARCFQDGRDPALTEHSVATLVGQRVFPLALGYEDLIDHDELRHDPVMAVLAGKLEARRADCAPLAGKSTLNRLEHAPSGAPSRYHKIGHDAAAIERQFVALFLAAHRRPAKQIIIDLDATDDPLHGEQEDRFFHGYYDCYCYLPLYIFCGRHLLAAKLRPANIDGAAGAIEELARIVEQIRDDWPDVRILVRADSGFAREALMAWCEANRVDYVFGLARNKRLSGAIEDALAAAAADSRRTGKPARRYQELVWTTRKSWSRERRVVAKAEWTHGKANPRFVVTSLGTGEVKARRLYEKVYCARGDMENRIKGMPGRSVRRPHFGCHHAGQPAALVVRRHGLCAALRAAPHRPQAHPLRPRHLRHHPLEAVEDRRPGAPLRPPRQVRNGVFVPLPAGIPPGSPSIMQRHRLTPAAGLRPSRQPHRINSSLRPPPAAGGTLQTACFTATHQQCPR